MKPNYVYVASSWRNDVQPKVVSALREAGIECYDFKNPNEENTGFHWSEVMPSFDNKKQLCDQDDYLLAITEPRSIEGFGSDMDAMRKADACVLVLPCGRSAHLELGWFVGKGKQTIVLLDGPEITPELMYLMVDHIAKDTQEVLDYFLRHGDFRPTTLRDVCSYVMEHMDREKFPKGMSALNVLDEIQRQFPGAFPLISFLDVHDTLRELYG